MSITLHVHARRRALIRTTHQCLQLHGHRKQALRPQVSISNQGDCIRHISLAWVTSELALDPNLWNILKMTRRHRVVPKSRKYLWWTTGQSHIFQSHLKRILILNDAARPLIRLRATLRPSFPPRRSMLNQYALNVPGATLKGRPVPGYHLVQPLLWRMLGATHRRKDLLFGATESNYHDRGWAPFGEPRRCLTQILYVSRAELPRSIFKLA
jgi:hypothetical protein